MPPWMFNLEGTFLGFIGKTPDKPTSIILEVDQEPMAIRLPKKRSADLFQQLQPGDRIGCVGRSQLDVETGSVRLDAYGLFSLTEPLPVSDDKPAELDCANVAEDSPCPRKTRGKILVCRKSGCQKRGGKQLAVALEQALRDRQLHDDIAIQYTGCQKRCSKAPTVTVMPGKHRYEKLSPKHLRTLIDKHFGPAQPHSGQPRPVVHHDHN